jgi:O-antigen ligase
VYGLLASVILLFFSEIPAIPAGTRTLLVSVGTGLIWLLLATCRGFLENVWGAIRRGPTPFLLLLLGWSGYCLFTAPYWSLALGEFLRVLAGVGAYFLAAYALKTPVQIGGLVAGLLIFGVGVSLWDLSNIGQKGGINASLTTEFSAFGTHENIGTLLVLLTPLALSYAFHTGIEEKRRLMAMAAALTLGGLLLVSRTRSAWLGGAVELLVLAALYARFGPKSDEDGKQRRHPVQRVISSPAFIVALGFGLFVAVAGVGPVLMKRASLAGALDDASLRERVNKWTGAALMASEKPLTGWGLGSYYVLQGRWTHTGDEWVAVLQKGVRHENIAHNYCAQWAADTGAVGLFLHGAFLTAFLLVTLRRLPGENSPFVVATVSGGFAAACGSLVDGIGSPGYNFHGVFAIYLTVLGLTVGAMRPPNVRDATPPPTPAVGPQPVWVPVVACVSGLVLALGFVGWGASIVAKGKTLRHGTLEVKADPSGPVPRGTSVVWTAYFTDENGKPQPTMPGVEWRILGNDTIQRQAQAELIEYEYDDGKLRDFRNSVLRVLVPNVGGDFGTVTAKATYKDRYGRVYTAYSMKTVR